MYIKSMTPQEQARCIAYERKVIERMQPVDTSIRFLPPWAKRVNVKSTLLEGMRYKIVYGKPDLLVPKPAPQIQRILRGPYKILRAVITALIKLFKKDRITFL